MKKRLFLVISLCVLILAGGCGKKSVSEELDSAGAETETTEDTAGETNTDGDAAAEETAEEAPVKEKYNVSDYIKLGKYKGVEVTVEKLEVTKEDVDAQIQSELEANSTEEEVTGRAVESGDIVNIDYEGLKDGVAFEGGTAQGYDLVIGSGSFIEGFEDSLIGKKTGDKYDLDITFPENYQSEELAGQPVVFKITVNAIKKSVVPELTEDYVKENTDYESIDAYKSGVRATLEADNADIMESNKISSVLTAIVDGSEISSYPQTLLDYYSYQMKSYYTKYAQMYGMEFADFLAASGMTEESFDSELQEFAKQRAAQELVLNAIIEAEKMEISDQEYKDGIAKYVEEYGYESEEEFLKTATEEQIRESLLWDKALNFVAEQAVVL